MSVQFTFKNIRRQKRMSQQNLALRLGISQSYLNELENNKYKVSPRMELIERLSIELKVPMYHLYNHNIDNMSM